MDKEINMSAVVDEIKNAKEDELKKLIEDWFEKTRTDGLKIGAQLISAAVLGVIKKHLKKGTKPSLRDYQRAVDEILNIISVQLAQQNDSEEVVTEENKNDGTEQSNDNTNS